LSTLRKDHGFLSRFKYDLGLLTLLALLLGGVLLNAHPFQFDAEDIEIDGALPPQVGRGDTLLLLPASDSVAETFGELDFSFAWYNTLAQEVGPFRIQLGSALARADLQQLQLVVVPARVAHSLDAASIALLLDFVEKGGSLIVEMPSPSWVKLTGIQENPGYAKSMKQLTAAVGSSLQGDFRLHLLDTPISGPLMRLDLLDISAIAHGDPLLEVDGIPAHFHRNVGLGHVFVLGFDFGRVITALQQGLPEDDFSVVDNAEEQTEFTSSEALMAHAKMRNAGVPYADLLERHVIYATLRYRPAPRLWHFANDALGALCLTHDEHSFGDRSAFFAEYEAAHQASSTYFVSTREVTNDGLDALSALGIEIGLAWHRSSPDPIYQSKGVGRFTPYQIALSLTEQRDLLQGWAARRIVSARVHDGVWDRDYFSNFRKLAGGGVYVDSSYGPSSENYWGYLFGTGLPFYVIDRNGLPLPLYELPFLASDESRLRVDDVDVLAKLLRESKAGFHQLVTASVDADSMARQPRSDTLESYLAAIALASEQKLWITQVVEYVLFYDSRRSAEMVSSFDRNTRTLSVELRLPSLMSPRGLPLPSPGVAVPASFEGGGVESVLLDGIKLDDKKLVHTADGILLIVSVSPGSHSLELKYRGL
jgi:hypothetical protein